MKAKEEARAKQETNVEDKVKAKAEEEANAKAKLAVKAEEEAKAKTESAVKAEEEANVKVEEEASAKFESAAKAEEEAKAKAESAVKAEEEAKAKVESAIKAEEEAIAKFETDMEEEVKAKAEEEAKAKAESAVKAEEEAKAKAESAARAEEEAKAKAELAAKAEVESKARAEAVEKATEENKPELKTSRKKGKKNRLRSKTKERIRNKSQEEQNNEAKIIAASEDYAEAIASAMAEIKIKIETKPNKNITTDTKEETISEAELLPNLDLSAFKPDDIKGTIESDTEIAEITSEVGKGIQRKTHTRDETPVTESRIWQEEETKVQAATFPSLWHRRKPINLSKVVPLLFVAFVCVTLLLPYVLPTSQYISTIEKSATDSISEPVKIGSLHVTFLPIPSVEASAVTIGSNIKIKSAILTFSIFSSFNSKDLKIIELTGVSVLPSAYDNITRWKRLSNAPQLPELKKIELNETKLEFKNISVPILSGSINLSDNNKFSGASFTTNDKRININISPSQNNYLLNISAKEWKPSLSSPMVLSDLDAKIIMSTGLFQINEIDGRIYDGVLKGTASAKWKDRWSLNGELEIERINIKEAAISYNTDIPMEGKLFSRVEISSESLEFEQLYDAMHINGTFQLQNGFVSIDLGNSIRTTSKGSIPSGQTRFDELSGVLKVIDKHYQLKQLELSSGILSAEGTLNINSEEKLSGEIISNLKGGHTMSSGPISLEGTIKDPLLVRY